MVNYIIFVLMFMKWGLESICEYKFLQWGAELFLDLPILISRKNQTRLCKSLLNMDYASRYSAFSI